MRHEAWKIDGTNPNPVRSGSPADWLRPEDDDAVLPSPTAFPVSPPQHTNDQHNQDGVDVPSGGDDVVRGGVLSPFAMNVGMEGPEADKREPVDLSPSFARGARTAGICGFSEPSTLKFSFL